MRGIHAAVGLNGGEYPHETLSLCRVKSRLQTPYAKTVFASSSTITWSTEDLNVAKPSCSPGSNIKSRIADAAITRTDVHVIAISPSRPGIGAPNNKSAQKQSAAPAMQVVKLGNGMYEAVWDDESFDENSDSGRESIAGEVSEATSASFFGLKRVNTQLVEWSWIRGLPKDKAKTVERPAPEIVVFVDDSHEQHPHLDCAVEDDNDLIIASPNSERPSANSTRPISPWQRENVFICVIH